MADVKISALPAATTPLTGGEVLPIVQSSTTKQVAVSNLTAGLTGTASININGTVGATTPSTGAFTTLNLSSTSTISGAMTFTSYNPGWVIAPTVVTNSAYGQYVNTGGNTYVGIDNSTGGDFGGAAGNYGFNIYRPSVGFAISRAGVVDIGITSAGAVSIPGTLAAGATTVTGTLSATGTVSGPNLQGPTFSAYRGASSQSISNATYTKVQINTEEWDTASCFDPTTNFRFTPTVAGYYQVSGNVTYDPAAAGKFFCTIYKNGSDFKSGSSVPFVATQYLAAAVSALVYLNGSTDYIELYTYQSSGGALTMYDSLNFTFFQAAMVRSA